ncbi:MAG: hypothetical protein ABSC56_03735 [Solirubrobacteraceae bacterium]
MSTAVAPRTYTAQQVDAAVARLADPDRFTHASEIVSHAAPSLAGVLDAALTEGGWFGAAHEELLRQAGDEEDAAARLAAIGALVDEQTRLGMLVGVAVGFQLASELADLDNQPSEEG